MIKLDFWLQNSPGLSPLESVWCLIQQKIEGLKFNDLDELEKKILYFWNWILSNYYQKLFDKFINDINKLYKDGKLGNGNNNKKDSRTSFRKEGEYKDEIENIDYKEIFVEKIIKNKVKFLQKKINEFLSI